MIFSLQAATIVRPMNLSRPSEFLPLVGSLDRTLALTERAVEREKKKEKSTKDYQVVVLQMGSTIGSAIITAYQEGNINYEAATPVDQVLTVNKAFQTITFDPIPTKTNESEVFRLGATASSGLPIYYTSSNTSVALINGSEVTILGVGTADITALQDGNENFQSATPATQALLVSMITAIQDEVLTIKPISLFPNPVTREMNLNLESIRADKSVELTIVDITGRVVFSSKCKGGDQLTISLENLTQGIYYLRIAQEGLFGMKKFSKL